MFVASTGCCGWSLMIIEVGEQIKLIAAIASFLKTSMSHFFRATQFTDGTSGMVSLRLRNPAKSIKHSACTVERDPQASYCNSVSRPGFKGVVLDCIWQYSHRFCPALGKQDLVLFFDGAIGFDSTGGKECTVGFTLSVLWMKKLIISMDVLHIVSFWKISI